MIKTNDPLELKQAELTDVVDAQEFMPEVADVGSDPFAEEPTEEVQVAGLGKLAKGIVSAAKEAPRTPKRPDLTVKPVDPTEAIETPPEAPQAPQMPEMPDPSQAPVSGKPPERIFNLDQINDSDSLRQYIDFVAEQSGAKVEKMDFKQLAKEVDEMGYSQEFVARVINVNEKLNADPVEVRKMLLTLVDSGRKTMDLANKVDEAAEAGTLSPDLLVEFQQALALEGAISRGVKKKQADIARSLAMFNQARSSSVNRAQELDRAIESMGGKEDVVAIARMYQSGKGGELSHNIAESAYTFGKRIKDVAMSTWINGLLSAPPTHFKNMFANGLFLGLNLGEKQIAQLIGKGRNLIFKSEDRITQDDVSIAIRSVAQGINEGSALFMESLKKNKQITGLSKVETQQILDPFNIEIGEGSSAAQKGAAKALGMYGKFVTVPGRLLMAEDEFFKAVNYRIQLNTLAAQEGREYLAELLKGKDKLTTEELIAANDEAVAYAKRLVSDPTLSNNDIHKQALDHAAEMTFTKELEGSLKSIERGINRHPLLKIIAPFFRTPANIAIELNKRLPTSLMSAKTKADIKAGGVRRDMALAKITMGVGIIGGLSSLAIDNKITGAGPFSYKTRQLWERKGWQPYSFVYDRSEISAEKAESMRKWTNVFETEDKVFISYAGMEPVGALLGMAATLGEYSIVAGNDQEADINDLSMGLAAGMADYLSELPMISGLSQVMNTVTGRGTDPEKYWESMQSKAAEQVTSVGIGMTPPGSYSSLVAYVNRLFSEEKLLPRPDIKGYDDLDPFAKGFYDALERSHSRNPFTSSKVARQLDPITGKVLEHPTSMFARGWFNKVSEGKDIPAYNIMAMLGIQDKAPSKRIDDVQLTASQYNRLIELATEANEDGLTLADEIAAFADDDDFWELIDSETVEGEEPGRLKAKRLVDRVISDRYRIAREKLKEDNFELSVAKGAKQQKQADKLTPMIEAMKSSIGR